MRRVEYKKSFDNTYRNCSTAEQLKVDLAIRGFLDAVEKKELPKGVGLKRLQNDHWEIRVDLRLRVTFRMSGDQVEFGLVGNHEAVRKFLKNL